MSVCLVCSSIKKLVSACGLSSGGRMPPLPDVTSRALGGLDAALVAPPEPPAVAPGAAPPS